MGRLPGAPRQGRTNGRACRIIGCLYELADEDDQWDLGICHSCGKRIARRYKLFLAMEEMNQEQEQRRAQTAAYEDQQRRRKAELLPIVSPIQNYSVVYYARIGDVIKIGYSANLINRIRSLRIKREDVLVIEPGSRIEERDRHWEFSDERVDPKREDFRPSQRLLDHIERLKAEHGRPPWLEKPWRSRRASPVVVTFKKPE